MPTSQSKSASSFILKDQFSSFLFVLPALAIFSLFYIIPFVQTFWLSLHEWNGITPQQQFNGLVNFRDLFGDKVWWDAIGHAGFITLIALTFQNALAFALALACDQEIRLGRLYRVIFFLPPVLSEVVVGLIWQWILYSGTQGGEQIGLLNYFLGKSGLSFLIHSWLSDPKTALTCIAIVHSWKGFGWGFIILLAGLQTIDRQLYEAAKVDGAGVWKTFLNVTIPMMIPVILFVVILTILGAMQVFVLVLSMVGQGLVYYTEVPVTRILASMTGTHQFGYACAQAVIFGIILISVSMPLRIFSEKIKKI